MGGVKGIFGSLLTRKAFKKVIAYILLVLFIFIFQDFLGIFFLTFIFAYLFFSTAQFIQEKLQKLGTKTTKLEKLKKTPLWMIIILEYIVFIGLIIYFISNIIPTLKFEISSIVQEFSMTSQLEELGEAHSVIQGVSMGESPESGATKIIHGFNDVKANLLQKLILIDPEDNLKLTHYIENLGSEFNLEESGKKILGTFGAVGSILGKTILALILSFIFIVDRKKLGIYLYQIKESHFRFLYDEYEFLLDKIAKSFGVIFKAQSMIALVNALLTVLGLFIIGLVFRDSGNPGFPYILTLGLVVFVFGFVPVLGVVLSSIPIFLVAYMNYGDPMVIFMIMALIVVIHMIEAYYLNPKIVSRFLELPVSLTFVILLVSEHFFGLAGLLIGVSLFYFSISLLQDFNGSLEVKKKKKFFGKKIPKITLDKKKL